MDFLLQNLIIFIWLAALAYFAWKKTEYGIYLIIFSLPIYLLRTSIYSIPTTALELGVYILFGVWLIKNVSNLSLRGVPQGDEAIYSRKREQRLLHPFQSFAMTAVRILNNEKILFLGIFLLMAGVIISTIFSSDIKTSAGILKGWFFDPFLFFIVLISVIKTAEQKVNALKALFYSGAAIAIISLVNYTFPALGGVTFDGRLSGLYLSPNYLAMYLSPAFLIGIGFAIRGKEYQYYLGAAVIATALYFTFSYSAWIAVITSLSAAGFVVFKNLSLKRKILLMVFFVASIAILFTSQLSSNKFDNLVNLVSRSSFNSRMMIWRAALDIGKDNPIIGISPGNFQKYYLDYQKKYPEPYLEWAVPQPHNVFLAFWLQTGIVGLTGFILILYSISMLCLKAVKYNTGDSRIITAACLFIMLYIVLHGLFDTTYWKNDLSVIFWLIIGISAQRIK